MTTETEPHVVDKTGQRVAEALEATSRARVSNGEVWLDGNCLFHDDAHASASFQPDTGVYYCRAEDETYPLEEVLQALGLTSDAELAAAAILREEVMPTARVRPDQAPITRPRAQWPAVATTRAEPEVSYLYWWPTEPPTPSHFKHRIGQGADKQVWQSGVEGPNSPVPTERYPLYGDVKAPPLRSSENNQIRKSREVKHECRIRPE